MLSENSHPQYAVRIIKNVPIPLSDGNYLSAHLIMPAGTGPLPAVFDYYPYRKDDTSAANLRRQYYLAERGFVGIRIDVRGTGGSTGLAEDEYTRQEQLDGLEAIAWLAEQPWCNGNVGMFGTSYGGFNSLQDWFVTIHLLPHQQQKSPQIDTDGHRLSKNLNISGKICVHLWI
jgi:predicted acyl esterase